MDIAKGIEELIGHTPMIELSNYERNHALDARLVAKLEMFNPAGSVKDRVAASMLADFEEKGRLGEGAVIIEPTSGNTGIGLAALCAARGIRMILVMPETMSIERRRLAAAYGAEVVLTEGARGMAGAIERADEMAREIPGAIVAGQFVNPANPAAHVATTGPEIWQQTDGNVDVFVAGVGTGGTVTGVGRYLKERKPDVYVVAVEPAGSPVLSEGRAGSHGLQGIGAGFVPEVLDTSVYDEVMAITDDEAYDAGRELAAHEGLLVGISSGAAVAAAAKLAARPEFAGKLIVALLPDTGERYLSTPMFA